MNYTDQQLDELFDRLPESIQDFILSAEVERIVNGLITKYGISKEEVFRRSVFLVLVGQNSADDFINSLITDLNLPVEQAEEIFNTAVPTLFAGVWTLTGQLDKINTDNARLVGTPQDNTTKSRLINEIEHPAATPMRSISESHPEIKSAPLFAPTSQPQMYAPGPVEPTPSAPPSNLPMEIHDDPMPIIIRPDPEKKPMIDTSLPRETGFQRPEVKFNSRSRPSLSDEHRRMVDVPNISLEDDTQKGNDPYREMPL